MFFSERNKRSYGRFFIVLTILFGLHPDSHSQDTAFHVAFYNVENLFDTIDAPDKKDDEFTPAGKLGHSRARYNIKLDHLAMVIDSFSENRSVGLIGLCEVENQTVVDDLASKLNYSKYTVVHYESPDQRGIDNALLIDRRRFKIIVSGIGTIDLGLDERPTRDIVWSHVKHKKTKEEFLVFVNHWPSRYGGAEASNWKRVKAAKTLTSLIKKLSDTYPKARVIAMGDLNDYPTNESVQLLSNCDSGPCMVNPFNRFVDLGLGSHAYKGEWGVLDHILVSQSMTSKENGLYIDENASRIFKKKWMMYESTYDQKLYPSRAYGRDKFYGGYSDHLPVLLGIIK